MLTPEQIQSIAQQRGDTVIDPQNQNRAQELNNAWSSKETPETFGSGLPGAKQMSGQEFINQPYIKQVAQAFVHTAPKDVVDFFKFIPEAAKELAVSAGQAPTDIMTSLQGKPISTQPVDYSGIPVVGKYLSGTKSLQAQAQEAINKPEPEPVSPWEKAVLGSTGQEVINSNKPFGFHAFVAPILKLAMDGTITEGALKSAVKYAGQIFGDAPASALLTGDFSKGTPGLVQKIPGALGGIKEQVQGKGQDILQKSAQGVWERPSDTPKASYKKATEIFDNAADGGNDISERLIKQGILPSENITGKNFDTLEAASNIRDDNATASSQMLRPLLQKASPGVEYVPIDDVMQGVKDSVGESKYILPEDKVKILNRIENEIQPALETKYPDGMSLVNLHDEKILRDMNAGYKWNATLEDNLKAQTNKQIADSLRNTLEEVAPPNIPVSAFNEELKRNYQMADYLEALNNKPVPKTMMGRLGNLGGKIAGLATAQHLGGGILTDVVGYHAGGMIENMLSNLPGEARDMFLQGLQEENPEAFKLVAQAMKDLTEQQSSMLALPEAAGSSSQINLPEPGVLKGQQNIKPGNIESIIEQSGGWKPGMRVKFDTALYKEDAKTIKALLPEVPKEYAERFADDIKRILNK